MTKGLPVVFCDFNACGWSGEANDPCYYVLSVSDCPWTTLAPGMRIIGYHDDSEMDVVACEGELEQWTERLRFRPDDSTWAHLSITDLNELRLMTKPVVPELGNADGKSHDERL